MKSVRVLGMSAMLCAIAASTLLAQARSPEEIAKSTAARWKPILGLSEEQTARFEAISLTAEKKTAEARTASGGDKDKLRETMRPILKERNAAVEKVLTPDQMKKYESAMAMARKKAAEPAPAKPPA